MLSVKQSRGYQHPTHRAFLPYLLPGLVLFLLGNTVMAQQYPDSPMADAINRCRAIQDTRARIACYDAIPEPSAREDSGSHESGNTMQQDWRQREAMARARSRADYGNNREQPRTGVIINEDGKQELFSRITELEKNPNGWIITLENGQIWRQVISKRYYLREGQEVRVYPSAWGEDYRLAAEELGSFIQVERVR